MGLESEMCNGGSQDHLPQSKNGLEATKRVYHNGIEKKRKDRLKSAIHDIRKIIPLAILSNKKATHCDVLEKAGEYIKSLEDENRRLLCSSNEDVRAEIIAKLRKEREDLVKEKQHLMEIIEFPGMHSNVNQTVLTADWRRRSAIVTVHNSENSPLTNCNQSSFPKNNEASSGGTVVEKTSTVGKDENLSTLNPSLLNSDLSANQKNVSNYSESHTMSCKNLSVTGKSLVSSCDKSVTGCNGSAADPKCSDLVLKNEDHLVSAVLPAGGTSQPSKTQQKPRPTINLYFAERKNLQTPVVTMVQSNPLPVTSTFLDNGLVKSLISCQAIANSSLCTTGAVNHSTPALAVVLGSRHTQPDGSTGIETELTTICAAMDSVLPVCLAKNPGKVLPCNDTAINQNSAMAKCNSNFEENVDIIECCKASGIQLSSEKAFHSDTLLKEQQFENELVTRTDTHVTVTDAGNETKAALSASNESRIDVVTVAKSTCGNSNPSLGMCCHCKKLEMVVSMYDNKQRNRLRKCKSSEDLGKNYLERDNIEKPHFSKMQRDWTNENKPTQILLDRKGSNLERFDQETSSDMLEDCQSKEKDSCRESDKLAVENMNLVSCEMLAAMQKVKDLSEDVPCSVVENFSGSSPESTVSASLSPQSSYTRYPEDRVIGLFSSSSSSLWNGTGNESQSKLSICHNGHVFVMSDTGQNWLPITTSSLMSIPNNTLLSLPNASPIAFQSPAQGVQNASSSIQLIGSLNPVVLPTINQPLTIFLPSSQVIPFVSQPQIISPSVIVPYHQLYGTAVQVASMSSVPQICTMLSTNVARNLHDTNVVDANQHSDGVTSYLTSSEANRNNSGSVLCLHSSSESSLSSDLPTSSTSDTTINAVDTSSNSMETTTSVMSVSQGISQEVISLCSSEILLDSGKKNLKRKLSMTFCTEPEVVNVCRKPRLSSPSEVFEKHGLHLKAQTESSQVQNPKNSEPSAQSNSLSEDLPGEEIATRAISKLNSNIGMAYMPNSNSTRNLCSEAIITQSSLPDICVDSSVSNLNEDGEHDKNLLVSDIHGSGLIVKTDKCVAGHPVDHEAYECDNPLSLLQNKSLENSGNKEPIESFPFVEKPSLWLLDFESRGKLPHAKLTADDNNISQFSGLKSSGWPALTSEHQDSQILHNDPARNGQSSSATVITQESPSYSPSSKRELEDTITREVQCADLQRDEICGLFEPTASEQVEKVCRSNSTSEESNANQLMNDGRSKGSVVAHMSPHQKDELNQSTLLSHEHWLSDISYRNSILRPYELDTINLDKHIWAPAVDVDKMDQLNLSISTTSQTPGQLGMKRPSKTSKSQKKKLISKVWADSEVSGRSVENVSLFNQGNNAMFSFNAPLSSQHREFSFQSFLPPPLPPLSQKSAGEGLLEAADKPTNYREVYQSLKSRQPENSSGVLVMPPTEVNEMIAQSGGNIEKQNVESFNEDSSNVLSDTLNFGDNDDFSQIDLDEMDTIMDTHSAHGKPANHTKSMVAAWQQDLFGSSKRSKLRDKTDLDGNRHMDLDDRFPIHHRQDLFGFSADVFTENDDSSAVGSFGNVLLNRKVNVSSSASWQLPVFSESLNTPEKFSYLTASEHAFTSGTSKPYAGNNLYAATDGSSFHLDSAQVACTRSARPKTIASGGIFCLAQHAVQEKSDTANNQLNGQNYDFSYSLKEFPGTCRVESSKRNLEQTFGLRNRNFSNYNLPFYNNESYSNIVNNVRCPPQSSLWPSYSNKDQTKPTYDSTSSAVVSSATHLSFRPQVEVEYSNESHRTKVNAVQITSSLLSHSHGSNEKDAPSTSVQPMDGLTCAGSSWNDRVREQSFLPDSPWKSSYCTSSSLRSGATDIGRGNSPRNAFITATTLSGSAEPNGKACDQFHFSMSVPPSTIHGSALPSSTTLPPFSLACLPLEHSSSFSFNLTAVPDMNSADVATANNQCSQEKRNQFSFYPLEHIEDDLPHAVPSGGRITSPPPCSQVTVSNFTFNGCELSSKNNSMRRNGAESLQHRGKSRLSPDNQLKPLPSFFNIASYGMKDKILAPVCSEAFPHSKDLGSSSALIHSGSAAAVTHTMSFSPTSISNSCSLNAYHPQNFYHHGATFPGSLTSPPLHHPPLAADRRLSSEPQSKFDSSFSLHGLQFPPGLNFVPPPAPHPHPHPPAFDSSMVRFSSQIIGDPARVCVSENSIGKASHLSENIGSKVPSSLVPHDQHARQPTPSETRSSKSSSKRSSRSSRKLSSRQTLHNDRNVTENSETVNPYFTLPNFSSGKNHSGIPTYFSSHPFRGEQGSCTTSSFNPLLTGPQASLKLCQPSSGFVNISTSTQMPHTTSVPVLPPIHNFGFGNLFSDLNNPTALGGDGMSISPVKFPQGVPPPPPPSVLPKQTTFDPSPLHHQPISKMPPIFLNHTTASSPPNILHNMSITSLLADQRPRFEDARTVTSAAAVTSASGSVTGGMTTPFGLYRP